MISHVLSFKSPTFYSIHLYGCPCFFLFLSVFLPLPPSLPSPSPSFPSSPLSLPLPPSLPPSSPSFPSSSVSFSSSPLSFPLPHSSCVNDDSDRLCLGPCSFPSLCTAADHSRHCPLLGWGHGIQSGRQTKMSGSLRLTPYHHTYTIIPVKVTVWWLRCLIMTAS